MSFSPADLVTRGVSYHAPPSHKKHHEVDTKIKPEKKKQMKVEINLTKPDNLVGRPIVKIKKRLAKEAEDLHKEHEEREKKKKEEPKKEEVEMVIKEEVEKPKRVRKPKVDLVSKIDEMSKTIAELRSEKAKEDEKDAMKIKYLEEESKVKVPRKGRFAKGSQEAKDHMASIRSKRTKK
jgi:hypothetical protein